MSRTFEWTAVPTPPPNLPTGSVELNIAYALASAIGGAPGDPNLDDYYPMELTRDHRPKLQRLADQILDEGREEWSDIVLILWALDRHPEVRIEIVR